MNKETKAEKVQGSLIGWIFFSNRIYLIVFVRTKQREKKCRQLQMK